MSIVLTASLVLTMFQFAEMFNSHVLVIAVWLLSGVIVELILFS